MTVSPRNINEPQKRAACRMYFHLEDMFGSLQESIPQWLKAILVASFYGTAEAVPLTNRFPRCDWVALPDVLQRFGQCLQLDGFVGVAGVACEDKLIRVVFSGEDARHVLVGDDPVVHVVAHEVVVEQIAVADLHPDAEWLARGLRDQVLV